MTSVSDCLNPSSNKGWTDADEEELLEVDSLEDESLVESDSVEKAELPEEVPPQEQSSEMASKNNKGFFMLSLLSVFTGPEGRVYARCAYTKTARLPRRFVRGSELPFTRNVDGVARGSGDLVPLGLGVSVLNGDLTDSQSEGIVANGGETRVQRYGQEKRTDLSQSVLSKLAKMDSFDTVEHFNVSAER